MNLGHFYEFWAPIDAHPGVEPLRALYRRLGRDAADDHLMDELTSNLLSEAIGCACAIRYTFARLRATIAAAQREADDTGFYIEPPLPMPTHGRHWFSPSVSAAYLDFIDLMNWAKAFRERLSRLEGKAAVGLIPQLTETGWLKQDASSAYGALRARAG
jgi:hypothetical protein